MFKKIKKVQPNNIFPTQIDEPYIVQMIFSLSSNKNE